MVNSNKILTVSYGTFSCTLEGFEDAFGTMKAIAEYFRDLAADDRYFGAEPPTPDAEMLARIAEREIARRVEAQIENQNIRLRADPGSVLPVATRAAEAAPEKPEVHAEAAVARPQPADTEDTAGPAEAAEARAGDAATGFSGLTQLLTGRAKTSVDDTEELAEDLVAGEAEATEAPTIAADEAEEDEIAWPEDDAASFFETAETTQPAPEVQSDDTDSVAAKLSRIRAVVSQDNAAAVGTDFSEDEHADEFLADAHEDIEAALAIDDQAEKARDAWQVEEDTDDSAAVTALLDRFDSEEQAEAAQAEVELAEVELAEEESAEEELAEETFVAADLLQEVLTDEELADEPQAGEEPVGLEPDEDQKADADETLEEMEDIADETDVAEIDEDDALFSSDAEDSLFGSPEDAADALGGAAEDEVSETQIRARVIKMKRADFEAVVTSGDLEEDLDAATDELEDRDEDSSLSAEDEADLLRELAAVEAELAPPEDSGDEDEFAVVEFEEEDEDETPIDLSAFAGADSDEDDDDQGIAGPDYAEIFGDSDESEAEDEPVALDDAEDEEEQPRPTTRFTDDTETDMERMFDMADSQMDEEAGKGRRNAIAHLRAAVAAAKAEGGKIRTHGPDTEAYRDDLDSVVRPRRPEAGKTHTRRPNPTRPAPLKLVAEQRVDLEKTEERMPIRPRRVSAPAAELVDDITSDSDFAEYAENVGANSLPELLEAAAAYLSFVEGRKQFSRPQLMTQVRQVEQEDFSREDGLRSFGQLLREGKIEKLEGGRFKASESISYRPGKRYAGE
ncbi:chemotaxis protein CheA [Marimonas arenosa]|uniref:Chemotaxis protein CheA n=1 Tax=Marimonas arenosa TaxID=1795305 RepID=A0AAE3WD58_9RHOB|nr:chemotaxis protein CheA [Marimonas arenosa]MDQ2091066.1 chemotaxis protein CheA [Marimonas arenosa]